MNKVMNMMKKFFKSKAKVFVLSLLICVIATLAIGTLALFIDFDTAYNVITTGTIDMVLKETTIDEMGNEVPFPEEGFSNVVPGMKIPKKVWVENSGTESMYVRINVVNKFSPNDLDDRFVIFDDLNTEDWILKDGYYYYNYAVFAGEKTKPLFTGVYFDPAMPNEYKNVKLEVVVRAEVVQTKNNGANALEAVGWPAEN